VNQDGLAAGTYYIRVHTYYTTEYAPYTLSDSLFTPTISNDIEPDSTRAQALTLPLNGNAKGHIGYYYNNHRDSVDWYKVTTNADGRLRLTMTSANGQNVYADLYDNNGTTFITGTYTSGSAVVVNQDGLAAGTYYIRVHTYYTTEFAPYTLADSLFKPTEANDTEPDSTKATALTLPLNGSVTGHIGYYYTNHRDTIDEYKLTTTADGNINLSLSIPNGTSVWVALYDNNGTTLLHQDYTSGSFNYNVDGLSKGTYYIKVFCYYNSQFAPYTLKNTLSTYNANDVESNTYAKLARTLPSNITSTGHVGFYYNNARDTVDWFKINYTGTGIMSVALNVLPHITGGSDNTWMQIYKDTSSAPLYSNYTTATETANLTGLAEGYYYVKIFEYYNSQFTAYTVTPTFTQVDKARIVSTSYDTAANCNNNQISYRLTKSHAPYKVQLYRFGVPYGTAETVNAAKITFDSLPDGIYNATVYGDGATGAAKGKSDTVSIMPVPTNPHTTAIQSKQAKLLWNALPCASYFSIQYRVHNTATWTSIATNGNVSNYVLKGLKPSTSYDWQVAAADSENNMTITSPYTNIVTFTTASSLIADGNGDDQDNLSVNSDKNIGVITVAPNPAISYFTIHYNTSLKQQVVAILYDVNGKPVWTSGAINTDALNGKQVTVSQFGSGFYYLKITDNKGAVLGIAKVSITK
ncbi:MAG: T9SS type A sorting domain-containing protein, partial [Parafilimonas sp.]